MVGFIYSKSWYSTANCLGNAAVIEDNKPSFMPVMADWIQNCQEKKIANCEKFTLTSQTAFARTLKCHASLIEDLLAEGYDFIMPSRVQNDPLERQFGISTDE